MTRQRAAVVLFAAVVATLAGTLLSGCTPPSDGCGWTRPIRADAGFEDRWTVNEKRQVVAHNLSWYENCE